MSAQKNSFRDPPTINFDVLYHAARYTMLSPAFAIGLLLFTHVFQVQQLPILFLHPHLV